MISHLGSMVQRVAGRNAARRDSKDGSGGGQCRGPPTSAWRQFDPAPSHEGNMTWPPGEASGHRRCSEQPGTRIPTPTNRSARMRIAWSVAPRAIGVEGYSVERPPISQHVSRYSSKPSARPQGMDPDDLGSLLRLSGREHDDAST